MQRFQCLRCGKCCLWKGYVRVTQQEIDRIAEFLKIPLQQFINEHTRLTADRSGLSLLENPDGSCEWFAAAEKACLIEAVKPGQCAAFPVHWNFPGWDSICEAGIQNKKENRRS